MDLLYVISVGFVVRRLVGLRLELSALVVRPGLSVGFGRLGGVLRRGIGHCWLCLAIDEFTDEDDSVWVGL